MTHVASKHSFSDKTIGLEEWEKESEEWLREHWCEDI